MRVAGSGRLMTGRRKSVETALQIQIVEWLRVALPREWLVVHVPNQGASRANRAEAGLLTAMGMVAGFPDLLVFGGDDRRLANPDWMPAAWWLEVKSPGQEPRDNQLAVQDALARLRFSGRNVHSFEEARQAARIFGWPIREVGWNA